MPESDAAAGHTGSSIVQGANGQSPVLPSRTTQPLARGELGEGGRSPRCSGPDRGAVRRIPWRSVTDRRPDERPRGPIAQGRCVRSPQSAYTIPELGRRPFPPLEPKSPSLVLVQPPRLKGCSVPVAHEQAFQAAFAATQGPWSSVRLLQHLRTFERRSGLPAASRESLARRAPLACSDAPAAPVLVPPDR